MFLRIFRSGYYTDVLMFLLISALLWIPAFIQPPYAYFPSGLGLGSEFIRDNLQLPAIIAVILAFVVLIVQAVVLNFVLAGNPAFSKSLFLPAVIYIISMSHNPELLTLHPLLIANFFLIFSFKNLFNAYEKPQAFREAFNASFWISVASFFYYPAAFYIVFIWVSFFIFRINTWREWLISIIGFCAPYFFLVLFLFLSDQLNIFESYYIQGISWSGLTFNFGFHDYVFWPVFLLVLMVSLFKFIHERVDKVINIRKSFSVAIAFLIISGIMLLFNGFNATLQEFLIFPAAAIIIGFYFIESEKKFISELFFILLIVAVAVIKFL